MPQKNKPTKVTEEMRERSKRLKDEERQVNQIISRFHATYLRNIYDAFRAFSDEPKRLVLKAYRMAFRDDERRMKELEYTHPESGVSYRSYRSYRKKR